jgi:hypothetical protein
MQTITFGDRNFQANLQYASEFTSLDDFWFEGTPDVTVSGGSMYLRTALARDERHHYVSSVFCRERFREDVMIEFDARSIHLLSQRNFNFFIHTTMDDGRDLYQTRRERTGDYPEYHSMRNYLFTFLPTVVEAAGATEPTAARWRFRRNPGFTLIKEVISSTIEQQRWIHFQYSVHDGLVACSVDRNPLQTFGWHDPEPLREGYFGFRTYCSHLEYRNLRVWNIR